MNNGNIAVIGTQWGDEGKGKVVDYLASEFADVVVRWSGGDNAGHSISFGGKKYKVHSLPSGVLHEDKISIIGNGCVINPKNIIEEINNLNEAGFTCKNLKISDRAHIIMPYHIILDELQEKERSISNKIIGTTKKGIGPCYCDKFDRIGIRMVDLLDKNLFYSKLKYNIEYKNKILTSVYGHDAIEFDEVFDQFIKLADRLKSFITDTSYIIYSEQKSGKKILFEGAQGALLDVDHGTYPYVTSSSPIAGGISPGVGIGPMKISNILGVVKAYNTRVGSGAFPTILNNEIGEYIRQIGNEYGTTTGRPRSVGWLDLVALKYSSMISGISCLGITLLDVLSNLDEIFVAKEYTLNGKKIDFIPASEKDYSKCKPVYTKIPGWKCDITQVKSFDELPVEAKQYIKIIEETTSIPVVLFSVGPERDKTILIQNLF